MMLCKKGPSGYHGWLDQTLPLCFTFCTAGQAYRICCQRTNTRNGTAAAFHFPLQDITLLNHIGHGALHTYVQPWLLPCSISNAIGSPFTHHGNLDLFLAPAHPTAGAFAACYKAIWQNGTQVACKIMVSTPGRIQPRGMHCPHMCIILGFTNALQTQGPGHAAQPPQGTHRLLRPPCCVAEEVMRLRKQLASEALRRRLEAQAQADAGGQAVAAAAAEPPPVPDVDVVPAAALAEAIIGRNLSHPNIIPMCVLLGAGSQI